MISCGDWGGFYSKIKSNLGLTHDHMKFEWLIGHLWFTCGLQIVSCNEFSSNCPRLWPFFGSLADVISAGIYRYFFTTNM